MGPLISRHRPRAAWPSPWAWFLSLLLWALLAVSWDALAQPTTWRLTSDPLDPRTISVIITINGVDVPDCGPGLAACIDGTGKLTYDVTSLVAAGVPFTVEALSCNIVALCSAPSAVLDLDPSLPIQPGGLRVVPAP